MRTYTLLVALAPALARAQEVEKVLIPASDNNVCKDIGINEIQESLTVPGPEGEITTGKVITDEQKLLMQYCKNMFSDNSRKCQIIPACSNIPGTPWEKSNLNELCCESCKQAANDIQKGTLDCGNIGKNFDSDWGPKYKWAEHIVASASGEDVFVEVDENYEDFDADYNILNQEEEQEDTEETYEDFEFENDLVEEKQDTEETYEDFEFENDSVEESQPDEEKLLKDSDEIYEDFDLDTDIDIPYSYDDNLMDIPMAPQYDDLPEDEEKPVLSDENYQSFDDDY